MLASTIARSATAVAEGDPDLACTTAQRRAWPLRGSPPILVSSASLGLAAALAEAGGAVGRRACRRRRQRRGTATPAAAAATAARCSPGTSSPQVAARSGSTPAPQRPPAQPGPPGRRRATARTPAAARARRRSAPHAAERALCAVVFAGFDQSSHRRHAFPHARRTSASPQQRDVTPPAGFRWRTPSLDTCARAATCAAVRHQLRGFSTTYPAPAPPPRRPEQRRARPR